MSLLWNRVAMSRSSAVRSILRSRPAIVRDHLPSMQHNTPVAYYHRYSQSPSSVDATIRKMRRLDKRANVDRQAMKEALSPQQDALQKLGIVSDRLRSSTARTDDQRKQQSKEISSPPPSVHVRVRSVHAAQSFDVVKILSKVFAADQPVRHYFGKTSLIVQLKPLSPGEPFRFVAVYRFGSVVFFNMTTRESGKLLESIKKYGYVTMVCRWCALACVVFLLLYESSW